jgi:hypothetical protein
MPAACQGSLAGVDVDGTILDIIEAEEGLSPAIDACLPAAGVFPTIARER